MVKKATARRRKPARDEVIIQDLTDEQILQLIDERARYLLDMTGEEFIRRYRAGKIGYAPAEMSISMLADLVTR